MLLITTVKNADTEYSVFSTGKDGRIEQFAE